ncbi:PEP-CTERM sorting domain-containing protein [Candidatus Poribacteria bacterium]|nr:PEP-CTERM sorting domain-containing protein [Candidatus Poribacteria bacterium]
MKHLVLCLAVLVGLGLHGTASATLITASVTSSTAGTDLFPASQISDGSGLSGDPNGPGGASVTHISGAGSTWVTTDPGGFPSDYFASGGPIPVLTFDLGADTPIDGFAFWNYAFNNNSAKNISLCFATAADGIGGFGTTIPANPGFTLAFDVLAGDPQERQDFGFSAVTARYVEVTVPDNYFGIFTGAPGGDRVGMGELQFNAVPEPSTLVLFGVAICGVLGYAYRRKKAA